MEIRTDFDNLEHGQKITLVPNDDNPLHKEPIIAWYFSTGYFLCDGSNPDDGPDYYIGDVLKYNHGFF